MNNLKNKVFRKQKYFLKIIDPGDGLRDWFGNRFQVKRICVKPGGVLSLQSHSYRSEHWVVVAGTAKVQINNEINIITEGQSVYVPLGAIHRMENPGKNYMELIEVQIGEYLEEDDIVRYEDIYSRN